MYEKQDSTAIDCIELQCYSPLRYKNNKRRNSSAVSNNFFDYSHANYWHQKEENTCLVSLKETAIDKHNLQGHSLILHPRSTSVKVRQIVHYAKILLFCHLIYGSQSHAEAATTRLIYWNSTNSLFKDSGENLVVVQKDDLLRFICPTDGSEYYYIWWAADKTYFDDCTAIVNQKKAWKFLKCSGEMSYLLYQLSVSPYSATYGNPSFDSPVYIFTPSTGSYSGLTSLQGGACASRNMRLKIVMATESVQPVAATHTTLSHVSHKRASQQTIDEISNGDSSNIPSESNRLQPSSAIVQNGQGSSKEQLQQKGPVLSAPSFSTQHSCCATLAKVLLALILTLLFV